MIDLKDVRSLTDFQRNAKSHLRRLKKTGRPEVLTVNGEAALVVQSADSYQAILDDLELLKVLRGIRRGLDQAQRGEGRPMRDFLRELAGRYGTGLPR